MSQVHVRQIPLATSTDAQRIVGSWFPTSYYGNFRAKSRGDLAHYFRQLAQPLPPKKFVDRQMVEAQTHVFSNHDNRFRFECDPLVRNTQAGFGKRKPTTNRRGEFNPLLISWIPKTTDRKTHIDDAKITSYADDYSHQSTAPHILAEIQSLQNDNGKTSAASPLATTSVYASVYNHGHPDGEQSKQIRQETFQRFLSARTNHPKQKATGRGGSVASCMVWNRTNDENKPPVVKEKITNTVVPITLQPHVVPDKTTTAPRQRAQSAGPRLISTVPNQSSLPPPPPPPSVQKPFQQQSMQTTLNTQERPRTATTTSREHYTGVNFGPRITNPTPATPYEQTYANRMQTLISKYM